MRFGLIAILIFCTLFAHENVRAEAPLCANLFVERRAGEAKFHKKRNWGFQIYERALTDLDVFFETQAGKKPDELIGAMLENDVRRAFFVLQALSGVYMNADKKFFGAQRLRFKSIEDAIGHLDLKLSLRKKAAKAGAAELVAHFGHEAANARAELIATFDRVGLLRNHHATLQAWRGELAAYDGWLKGRKDRKFLVEQLTDYSRELAKQVKNNEFDHADIELGLHELRRRLRWVVIQIMTLEGLVEHAPSPRLSRRSSEWFQELSAANPDLLQGKYARVSTPVIDNPVLIPTEPHAIFAEIVTLIGKQKDNAELQIYFKEAMKELGTPAAQQDAVMKKLAEVTNSAAVDHQKLAREVQERLNKAETLKNFAKALEELNP